MFVAVKLPYPSSSIFGALEINVYHTGNVYQNKLSEKAWQNFNDLKLNTWPISILSIKTMTHPHDWHRNYNYGLMT